MILCGIFLRTLNTLVATDLKGCKSFCRISTLEKRRVVIFHCRYRSSVLTMRSLIWQFVRIYSFCIRNSYHLFFTGNPLKSFAGFRGRYGFSRFWRLIVGSHRMFYLSNRILRTWASRLISVLCPMSFRRVGTR